MKKFFMIVACLLTLTSVAGQTPKKSFDDFRKGILADYNTFRKSILDNYDKFLEGAWVEYEQMRGVKSDLTPKPSKAPTFKPGDVETDISLPTAVSPNIDIAPPPAKTPQDTDPAPSPSSNQAKPETPGQGRTRQLTVPFYGMDIEFDLPTISIKENILNTGEFASQWRALAKADVAGKLIPVIKDKAASMGLNDYLTYILVRDVVTASQPRADASSRTSLVHYLLANMGYDVRLAVTSNFEPLLLIPFQQMVYARPFMVIDDEKYFIFGYDGKAAFDTDTQITTCKLPEGADTGRPMNLIITPLTLPYKPHHYDISWQKMSISGQVNANIFPILHNYPQMPTGCFAISDVMPDVKRQVYDALSTYVNGLDEQQKINNLLHFVQQAFEYATDEDFHGFEKPYFFEEMLYYPKCDCEDRSIFLSHLLWNVAKIKNQLIAFPGHESIGVKLSEDIKGVSYRNGKETYYIADPTYIGASVGACMPTYTNTPPTIDLTIPATP